MDTEAFYEQVFEVVRLIPRGRVTSYGAVAKALGAPNYSRMVGRAMQFAGKAKPPVPWYRLVNSSGTLSARDQSGSAHRMQELLENEGIEIKNDRIVNFKKLFWDPLIEI